MELMGRMRVYWLDATLGHTRRARMAEKNGSPRLSAAAAEGEQQVEKVRRPARTKKEKPHLACAKIDADRDAGPMEPRQASDLHNTSRGMLDRTLQAQLGRQLRAIFSDVAEEPVPERFIRLLEALEDREKPR
jgi:hypothetical protein